MYAIIRAGGKQAKVRAGDVIDIERVKSTEDDMVFTPLLLVDDDGNAISDRTELAKATVHARVVGESAGPKIDIFKYKNKTGYRRSAGHRQKYTTIEVVSIDPPGSTRKKTAAKTAPTVEEPVEEAVAVAEAVEVETAPAEPKKTRTAKTSAEKKPAKTVAKKTAVAKTTAKKKPAAKKE